MVNELVEVIYSVEWRERLAHDVLDGEVLHINMEYSGSKRDIAVDATIWQSGGGDYGNRESCSGKYPRRNHFDPCELRGRRGDSSLVRVGRVLYMQGFTSLWGFLRYAVYGFRRPQPPAKPRDNAVLSLRKRLYAIVIGF